MWKCLGKKRSSSTEGGVATISAQNRGSRGDVTVTIYKDKSVFKTSTSNGAYAIADANGMIE
jgi:hypothetical protein